MYLIDNTGKAKKFDSTKEYERMFKTKTKVYDNDGKKIFKKIDMDTFKLKFG